MIGHLGDGKPIEVAQGERGPLRNGQLRQGGVHRVGVQQFVPRVLDLRGRGLRRGEAALFALEATPVVHQFVTRHAHEPGDTHLGHIALTTGFDGCQERLAGQVLGQRSAPAARQQIAVHPRQSHMIDGQHRVAPCGR